MLPRNWRKTVRAAYAHYLEAKRQHEAILNDEEIQGHFARGDNDAANALIETRYPLGRWETVTKAGQELIRQMVAVAPPKLFEGITPGDVWRHPDIFEQFVSLADQL